MENKSGTVLKKKSRSNRRRTLAVTLAAVLAAVVIPGLYSGLKLQHYDMYSHKLEKPIRIVLISDLHSCEYGQDEQKLISAIDEQNPDAVFMCGDIFDENRPDDNAEALIEGIGGRFPCWYVTGNHEYRVSGEVFSARMDLLEKYGIKRLDDEAVTVELNGQLVNLCGVNDPVSGRLRGSYVPDALGSYRNSEYIDFVSKLLNVSENGAFTFLLAHRPEYYETYFAGGCDLALSGHAHGGQWRIPGLVNGVFAPGQGFFPQHAGGMYTEGESALAVSRGLARSALPIPRLYNRPELVVIDIMPQ